MPRRLLGVFILLLVSTLLVQAQGDVVLLTVGGEAVSRDEFEYHFGKSPEKREGVFAETYAHFKQKVLAAKDLGIDTLPEVRRRLADCRMAMEGILSAGKGTASWEPAKEWIRLEHITYGLKQSAGRAEQCKGEQYMDSIYAALKKDTVVPVSAISWMQTRYLPDEWRSRLSTLAKDEYSKPFYSPSGIHIIVWREKLSGTDRKPAKLMSDGAFRLKELEEGLLAVALEEWVDRTLVCSEKMLETYFKKHRADYGGGVPHFKGAVVHCRDKKVAKAIKKYLKKYPQSRWDEAVRLMPENVSRGARIETGLFMIGANPFVDKLVFKCGDFEPLSENSYTWVLGKQLKKGPVDYRDVRKKLEQDCREALKMAEMEALMQKYGVEIDKEVLKTVNRAENK